VIQCRSNVVRASVWCTAGRLCTATTAATDPLQLGQRAAHADHELVEALQLLLQHHGGGRHVQAQLLVDEGQVEHGGQLVLDVLGHLADVLVPAHASAGLACRASHHSPINDFIDVGHTGPLVSDFIAHKTFHVNTSKQMYSYSYTVAFMNSRLQQFIYEEAGGCAGEYIDRYIDVLDIVIL